MDIRLLPPYLKTGGGVVWFQDGRSGQALYKKGIVISNYVIDGFVDVLTDEEQVDRFEDNLRTIPVEWVYKPFHITQPLLEEGNMGLFDKLQQNESKASTHPHLLVQARAGTGKTFTEIVGVLWMFKDKIPSLWPSLEERMGRQIEPSEQQLAIWKELKLSVDDVRTIRFCAFGKDVVKQFEEQWRWAILKLNRHGIMLSFSTMHSMGYQACCQNLPISKEMNRLRVLGIIEELTGHNRHHLLRVVSAVTFATEQLVKMCKLTLFHTDYEDEYEKMKVYDELEAMAERFEIRLEDMHGRSVKEQVFDLTLRVLERCREVREGEGIDYDDQIWLPCILNLPMPKYDLLLGDEVQDWNQCQQYIARKVGRRLTLVGDRAQSIYGFAGADDEAMDNLAQSLSRSSHGIKELSLTVTRRCGHAIVEEAKKIVPDFEAHGPNPVGRVMDWNGSEGVYGPWWNEIQQGDMILCRVSAPLIRWCLRFVARGLPARVLGRDVETSIVKFVEAFPSAYNWEDLLRQMNQWAIVEESKERKKSYPNEHKIMKNYDMVNCVRAVIEWLRTTETPVGINENPSNHDIIQTIRALFQDPDPGNTIRLATIHKAKGLEARRVFLLEPDGCQVPHPKITNPRQLKQEWNLRYVAITRAIEELVYVR